MSQPQSVSPSDEAAAHFQQGYNCAQSTAVVFAESFGLDRALVLRATAGFGGGIGGLRQTCGAVSAMAFWAGLALPEYGPGDLAAKTALYDLVRKMRDEFVARHGSDCCRELLERAGIPVEAAPSERTAAYYAARPCAAARGFRGRDHRVQAQAVTRTVRAARVLGFWVLASCCGNSTDGSGSDAGVEVSTASDGFLTADGAGVADLMSVAEGDEPVIRCSGMCNAAVPVYPTVDAGGGSGNVTMYTTESSSGGACNYGVTGVAYFAAINVSVEPGDGQGHWNGGRICGQCLQVTAFTSRGDESVVVRIMDRCADAFCGVDLGGEAPAAIMRDGFGRYDGSWRLVSCAGHPEVSDGPPSLHVVAGSNAWWSRVQVRNPPWAVESIGWRDPAGGAGGTFPYAADPENTFEVPAEVLQATLSSLAITVRYGDGTTATAELTPSQLASAGVSYPLQ